MPKIIVWVHMQTIGRAQRCVPPTAILMDQDAGVRRFLETILTSLGFRVYSCATANAAGAAVTGLAGEVSTFICDVDLRDGQGMAFVHSIARHFPNVPVVLTSAWGELPESAKRFPSLLKPFRPAELIELLSTVTGRRYFSANAA